MSDFFGQFNPGQPGWQFMWIILVYLVAAVAITIERMIYVFARANTNAPHFMSEIRKLVAAGDFKKAISLCKAAGSRALPQVVLAALTEAERREFIDFRAVQNAVDESSLEVIPKMSRRTGWLNTLAQISTLTGLLGTIVGLIISFKMVSDPEAAAAMGGAQKALAKGISVAMFTTMWGLIVAIPSTFFYTVINNKTQNLLDDIDEHSVKLIHLLTGGK